MSAAGRALSKALDAPDDWVFDTHRIMHKQSGVQFWISNGGCFFDGDPVSCLGWIERHWLYWKAMRVGNMQIAIRLKNGDIK